MGITEEYLKDKKNLLNKIKESKGFELTNYIIEYLFEDNYHNVTLNIKEMLRYNSICNILDEEKIKFYESILNINELPDEEKMYFFIQYKNASLNTSFYLDIRALRDDAIDKINTDLYKLNKKDKTDEYEYEFDDVDIYDLRDESFYMLVRCSKSLEETSDFAKNNYTLISQDNTSVYDTEGFIFGYKTIDKDYVLHMFEEDSMSHKLDRDEHTTGSEYVNRIMTSKELVDNSIDHSEIGIMNKKLNNGLYEVKKPDFIVCFDEVDRKSAHEANILNIPIVLINYRVPDMDIEEDKSNLKYR